MFSDHMESILPKKEITLAKWCANKQYLNGCHLRAQISSSLTNHTTARLRVAKAT
jgi:hypothetical protein